MSERVAFESVRPSGKVALEGELSLPDRSSDAPAVVLCHPHPAGGGEMSVGLLEVMDLRMVKAGLAVLRFNFGGVGRSEGHFTDGLEEPADIAAAFGFLKGTAGVDAGDVSVAGWSFGAWMCLLSLAEGLGAASCVAIAPPLMLYDWRQYAERIAGSPAVRSYIIGANDQFCPLDFLRAFTDAMSEEDTSRIMVMPATDHYLAGREDIVAELAIEHLT
jgi:uncharacterized protein